MHNIVQVTWVKCTVSPNMMIAILGRDAESNMKTFEIDVHGLTWSESLEEFISIYNGSLSDQQELDSIEIRVIHGYGSTGEGGTLRRRLRGFLSRASSYLEFTPGEEVDGNQGLTIVHPIQQLPAINDWLGESILEYCLRPKSLSKVVGKFRRHGQPGVLQAVRKLEKQGRLEKIRKGRVTHYKCK